MTIFKVLELITIKMYTQLIFRKNNIAIKKLFMKIVTIEKKKQPEKEQWFFVKKLSCKIINRRSKVMLNIMIIKIKI